MVTIIVISVLVVGGLLGLAMLLWRDRAERRAALRPAAELATATRLLDRILAYDEAMPALSIELRGEAREFVDNYYQQNRKELS